MDILVVKKLRAPESEELAIGAICADGAKVLHPEMIEELGVSPQYIDREVQVRLAEAQEAERRYRGSAVPLDIAGGAVLIIDDGMATGATAEAAVLSARRRGASSVAIAVPVGSSEACDRLRRVADDVFCLMTPSDFWAVGQFYVHFAPVEDDDVRALLSGERSAETRT
jgi:predicted phosphoribosyltransferase